MGHRKKFKYLGAPEQFRTGEILGVWNGCQRQGFGGGRRIWPGLPLAIRMLHLMLRSLINCFDWEHEGGLSPDEINMEEKFGITVQMAEPLRLVPVLV
ncbi:cytochrome P450, family 76, subfamily C, polypeptide 7 [Hibiscus trionum]|uniref:Cytochrome P450, family 76, subfamily C, polypeptide 7 n=1 Tax=Hibiscus trionum TaxID=183268 RepID=A0A9W7H680_HIBTR|nr:cytochrome P450, family 76, subfamily C, polypeptide 7 [Hibiscus trionum]